MPKKPPFGGKGRTSKPSNQTNTGRRREEDEKGGKAGAKSKNLPPWLKK